MESVSRTVIASRKYEATKSKLVQLLSEQDKHILTKYDQTMTIDALKSGRKVKLLDSILAMTKLLEGQEWISLDLDGIKSLVVKIMSKYSKDGQETNTTSDHKKILQQWFRFLKTGYRTAKDCQLELGYVNPDETRRIRIGKISNTVTAEDLVTPDEKKKLIKNCNNLRDLAIIDVLYDSGVRPHEILELQIKHVKSDKNGYTLLIKDDSKTGAREVRIIESVSSLADWLNVHPSSHDLEAPLFVNTGNLNFGKEYAYASVNKMLKSLCKKAKIRKLNLYLFRHTEITRRAQKMSDAETRIRHGWTSKSTVLSRYTHLTSKNANDSFLKIYGIEPENESLEINIPKICSICQRPNSTDREICYCGKPLTLEKAVMMDTQDNEKVKSIQGEMFQMLQQIIEENRKIKEEIALMKQQKMAQA
jgi:integrase/recombinase XerD